MKRLICGYVVAHYGLALRKLRVVVASKLAYVYSNTECAMSMYMFVRPFCT